MINLILAEYNIKTGKFLRYYTLPAMARILPYFGYYGDTLQLHQAETHGGTHGTLSKDNTDPLNRFDGLFNGRTYEGGMFVLIQDKQDDIYLHKKVVSHVLYKKQRDCISRTDQQTIIAEQELPATIGRYGRCGGGGKNIKTKWNGDEIWEEEEILTELAGNLHENPELLNKIEADNNRKENVWLKSRQKLKTNS